MKIIKYKRMKEVNHGTEEEPNIVQIFDVCGIQCTDDNFDACYTTAQSRAYNGEVTVEDDGQPDPKEVATGPSQDDINKFMMMQAQDVTDGIALAVPTMYDVWEADKRYGYDGCEKIVRVPATSVFKEDELYRCIQPHTSQADWKPVDTPALWVRINKSNAGTKDDPIPAARSMEYEYGLYYSDPEDGKIYLCTRTGEPEGTKVVLHYLPHELVGHYFKGVSE